MSLTRTRLASSAVLTCTALAVALAGCSSDQSEPPGIGNVDMEVTLATPPAGPNEQIDEIFVSFYCDGNDPVLGVPRPPMSNPETFTINTATSQGPEPYNTIGLFEKQGLPAGNCHFTYTATSNSGNTECTGEASPVLVVTDQTTSFEVVLACIHTPRYGGVRSDGSFNQCAEYRQILVTPTTQAIGNLVDVRTEVYDPDGDDVTVGVQAVGACSNVEFSNGDTAASCETVSGCDAVVNTVECTDVGLCQIIVALSDDGFTSCNGLLPDGSNNNAARSTIAVGCTAAQGLCAGVTCPDAGECLTNVCDPADGQCKPQNDGINTGCDLGGSAGVCDGAGACVECNMDSQCGAGETCVNNACEGAALVCEYEQDFEGLGLPADDAAALTNDGWRIFANVFQPDGTTYIRGYGGGGAPNGGDGYSAVVAGEGGPDQGEQQLSIYGDYINQPDQTAGNVIESNVYQERTIEAGDVGNTYTFTADFKRGNIEGASTALAFIKTLNPAAGFETTNFITEDTTNADTNWNTLSIQITIDAGLVGQLLQYGFQNTSSNNEGSGMFYDNVTFGPTGCGGGGGPGPGGELTTNGDFETGDTTGWADLSSAGATFAATTAESNGGQFSGNLAAGEAQLALVKQANIGIGQVQPNSTLEVSFDLLGSVGPGGVVIVEFFSEIDPEGTSKTEILYGPPDFPPNTWTSFSYNVTTGPDVSGGVTLQLKAECGAVGGCTADAYFDNVSVRIP